MMTTPDLSKTGPFMDDPDSPEEWLRRCRVNGRVSVPSKDGGVKQPLIVSMRSSAWVDDTAVDALIEARMTINHPIKRFAVIFSEERPRKLSVSTLWVPDLSAPGTWVVNVGSRENI